MTAPARRLVRNAFFLLASFFGAFLIVRMGSVDTFLLSIGGLTQAGSFIAGMFYTSMFTAIPSTVVLGEIALVASPWTVAAFGSIGAVVGDYLLFLIVRNGLQKDFEYLMGHRVFRRLRRWSRVNILKPLLPVLGAIVLASPLPDELGLMLLGLSSVDKDRFLLISLAMNFLGILVIGFAARAIAL